MNDSELSLVLRTSQVEFVLLKPKRRVVRYGVLQLRRWFITLSAMFTDLHVYMKVTVNGKAPKQLQMLCWTARTVVCCRNGGAISVANAVSRLGSCTSTTIFRSFYLIESLAIAISCQHRLSQSPSCSYVTGMVERLHVLRQDSSLHREGIPHHSIHCSLLRFRICAVISC